MGRYRKGGAAKIALTGEAGGKKVEFTYTANFATQSPDDSNGFVARLWATRRIGEIIDDLDLHGRNQELVEELVSVSQKYGIMTPYTSFLTDDAVNLTAVRANNMFAAGSVGRQMVQVTGQAGVQQREAKAQFQNATNLQQVSVMAAAAPIQAAGTPALNIASPAPAAKMQQIGQKVFFKNQI